MYYSRKAKLLALYLFWLSILLLFYTYVGFTVLLIIKATLFPKPYKSEETFPTVSMIIAAYNEADGIEAKIKNCLELDYPDERLEVIIASDGSEDATNDIVERYASDNIKLLALPRTGKAGALNAAVAQATGEILVFSDANSMYGKDAIIALSRPFADETVGGVAGDQRYLKSQKDMDNAGERGYWDFDRYLKEMESRGGHVISATGAIYAIRRSLFGEVVEGVTDDFYTSTRVIIQGYRLVFAGDAAAYEYVTKSQKREFGRKTRVMTRGLYSVIENRELLNPFKHGFYALQLFTHKVLRRLMYIPFIIIFLSNIFLFSSGLFYQLTMLGQIAFYGMALVGWFLERRGVSLPKILSLPTFFCMVYWAALVASWNVIRGHRIRRWSTVRQ